MGNSKTYTFCRVLPANYQSPYYYICDPEIKPGDIVVVPLRSKEKVGLVLEVNKYTEDTAPYPPSQTWRIIRVFGEHETGDLIKEKSVVDEEKAIRFMTDAQLKKISVKESLMRYSVGKEKIIAGKRIMKDILEAVFYENEAIEDMITYLSGGIILLADGKTVTGYNGKKKNGKTVISIPSGVETVEDNAFLRVDIDTLIIPKELKYLGKYTINNPYYGYGPYETVPKPIESIIVEEGNPYFMSDGVGLYSIGNGQKKLLRLFAKSVSTYVVPADVTDFEADAFSGCSSLERIVLSDGNEAFDEYALPYDTNVKEVFLSKTVKHFRAASLSGAYSARNIGFYKIDEDNETLFKDEDSIYEVLDDGTYKLVTCLYNGKGKVLFLDGTAIIGSNAFKGNKNITKIELPQSLRVIEEEAFADTSLQAVVIPSGVSRIESKAFYQCSELKSVQIDSQVEYIAEDAFMFCSEWLKIKSSGNDEYYIDNGVVKKRISLSPTADDASDLEWMRGKIFVHTGFSSSEEREFEQSVVTNGGIVKSSTVLATDYLVYNPDYDHETTKLRRARELNEQGKDIRILTIEEWNSMLNGQASELDDTQMKDHEDSSASAPVTNACVNDNGGQKSVPTVPQRDFFKEFAGKIVQTITEESVSSKDKAADRARFDEKNRKVSVILTFNQKSSDADIVKERVACAETLCENDPVNIIVNGDEWEITSKTGKSLGTLGWLIARQAVPYMNFFTVTNCLIASITPKSKRRANCKYALGSVKFDIIERPSEGLSEEDLVTRTQFSYSIDDNEAHLVRWIGDASVKTAIIPSVIEGKSVISLHPGLFERDMWTGIKCQVENIVISEGIQRIEAATLFGIEGLKKIVFPASVNYISPNVFSDNNGEYRDLYLEQNTIYVAPSGSYAERFLKEYKPDHYEVKVLLVMNEDAEESEDERKMMAAFDFEPSDSGLVLKFKKSYMLEGFKEKTVSVPNTINGEPVRNFDISEIPNFVECLIIPPNITNLPELTSHLLFYSNGQSLKRISIAEDNSEYWSDGSAIFSKDKKCLLRFMSYSAKKYVIPEGTERLAEYSFSGMKNLKTLILPSSLKSIADHVFFECEKLTDIQGFENVTEVGDRIFAGGGNWFYNGYTIPFERNSSVLIVGSKLLKYNDLSAKEIIVPDGITSIVDYAFGWKNDNDQVEEIRLPDSVREIGKGAFQGRSKLRRINIPDGVKEIRDITFYKCEALERLIIPASVETIDLSAFPKYQSAGKYTEEEKCSLKSIEVAADNSFYCSVNGMLLTKDKSQLLFIPYAIQKGKISIPDGVKIINDFLLSHNNIISEFVLPNSINKIGRGVFYHCTNLRKIVLPEGLEVISEDAFSYCSNLKTIIWPQKLKFIEDKAFYETGLTSVNLPETIEHIGSQAFADSKMKTVTVPKSVRTLGWGAFSGTPEIVVYDSIDPGAADAESAIDTLNGAPNSLVGYVGIGSAGTEWDCAANHYWLDYSIIVKSAESDEIKYKVWMGADESQRDYYCFLSSAWGHNATFAFSQLDEFFPGIRGKEHKIQVAKYRLEYPVDLSDTAKSKYESYIKRNSKTREEV